MMDTKLKIIIPRELFDLTQNLKKEKKTFKICGKK